MNNFKTIFQQLRSSSAQFSCVNITIGRGSSNKSINFHRRITIQAEGCAYMAVLLHRIQNAYENCTTIHSLSNSAWKKHRYFGS